MALVTAAQAVDLDEDAGPLIDALARIGVDAQLTVWDDDTVDWASWDLTVLRSAWDYPRRRWSFVAWAEHADAAGVVLNPPAVVAWNSDKRYLEALAGRGVAIVPSSVHAPGQDVPFPTDGPFVLKPAVSAGSQDTARYQPGDHAAAAVHGRRLHGQGRDVLVQPYLEQVDNLGETALIYVGDRFSHAIRKGPILAAPTETVAGLFAAEDIAVRAPSDAERAAAEVALDALPFDRSDLLYARVDLLPAADGTPLLLEVELVEPSLFLRFADGAADRFAAAIAARL